MIMVDDVTTTTTTATTTNDEDRHHHRSNVYTMPPPMDEHWFKVHWRPAAAWTYLGICIFDFVAAPVFFGWFSWFTKTEMLAWAPLTLQGGGLFHLSFGAIIGIYAWGRTREKFADDELLQSGNRN